MHQPAAVVVVQADFAVVGDDRRQVDQLFDGLVRLVDATQHPADVGDAVALGIRGVELEVAGHFPDRAEVRQYFAEGRVAALHVLAAHPRDGHEIVDLQLGALVAQAAAEHHRPEFVLRLHQWRDGLVGGRRHVADVRGDVALVGGVADQVQPQAHAQRQVEQVAAGPGELAAFLLGVDLGLVVPGLGAPGIEEVLVREAAVARGEVGPEHLRLEGAAGHVAVGVVQADRRGVVARRCQRLVARHRGRGDAGLVVARDDGVVAFAGQLEPVGRQLQAALVVERPARLGEQVMAVRVHQVALHGIDRDRIALAVVEQAFLCIRRAADEIERALAGAEQVRAPIAGAVVFAGQGGARAQRHFMEGFAIPARCALGDDVDDAAGCTQPLQCVGAVDHLDPLDHRRVDGVRVARTVAQRRGLGHAVDHVQRLPAAQRLAETRHLLPRRRERRDQVGQHLRQVAGHRQLLAQLLLVDDRDRVRERRVGIGDAAGAGRHHDAVQVGRDGLVDGALGMGGGGKGAGKGRGDGRGKDWAGHGHPGTWGTRRL